MSEYAKVDYYLSQGFEDWEIDPLFDQDMIPVPDRRDLAYAALGILVGVALSVLLRKKNA